MDLGQAEMGSPGVTEKLESMAIVPTQVLSWHLTILQTDKRKIRRNSPKPEGDPETQREIQMFKRSAWEKRVTGNLILLFQGPG